ncbi:hypothetical protein GGR95_003674 [Sulfitobacter undariae]|uniref:TnsA endonuclease N terminal n=1 Tax=Sulfitobacter undariae TaxID=1563671 RepID=A0A7W6E7A3_9RHOB|nr:hypothetical protein [Sulfitobacter undariae]MBB3996008.1 hypothetical protein [Sulfitobacter undariae]
MNDPEKHLKKAPAKSRAIRHIPKASKGHFVGELVYNNGDQPQRLGFASLSEHNAALCLIYRPDFLDLEEQLAALPFVLPNGAMSTHFFDFRFTNTSGHRVCISVKPERIAKTYEYRALIAQVKKAAVGNICDDVKTITERNIRPEELHNAKLFHAAREPDAVLDEIVSSHLSKQSDPIYIKDFLERAGIGGRGYFSVIRAIRAKRVALVTKAKITGQTLIVSKVAG